MTGLLQAETDSLKGGIVTENVLNIILKSDEAAKQKVASAEEYRREQLASLQSRKEEIKKNEIKRAVDEAVRNSERRKMASTSQLDEMKKTHQAAQEKMEELYKNNEKEWVETIVKNVLEG